MEEAYVQDGSDLKEEHRLRIVATAIIRALVTDAVALVGGYEAMEQNPIGMMLMERLEAAQELSVEATRQWMCGEH